MRLLLVLLICCVVRSAPALAADRVLLDDFEDVNGWTAAASEGTKVWLVQEPGATGMALRVGFDLNSAIVASLATASAVVVNGMAGYAFAKLRFAGRERILRLMLLALVVPGQIGMLPLFLIVRQLGLVNTLAGVVVPGLTSIFGILLVRQYALSIPDSILDAARVDGAHELGVFRRIAVPLVVPILATLAVFTFLGTWNDLLWPLVVLADESRYTLPVGLASLAGEHVQDTELMMAGAVVTIAPAVLLFVALQRYYLAGIIGGGVKE